MDATWNHNGQVVAFASSKNISLVSAADLSVIESIPAENIVSIRFGGKSRYLCIACHDAVLVWDLKKQSVTRRFPATQAVLYATLDPSDRYLYLLTLKSIECYKLREAEKTNWFETSSRNVCMDVSEKGNIALACINGAIQNLDSQLNPLSSTWKHTEDIRKVKYIDEDRVAVLGSTSISVLASNQTIWKQKLDGATCMDFLGDLVAVGHSSGAIDVYNWLKDELIASTNMNIFVSDVVFRPKIPPTSTNQIQVPLTLTEWNSLGSDIDELRDELLASLRNLHVDLLRQFQLQTQNVESMIEKQGQALTELAAENQSLRQENLLLHKAIDELRRNG